jgi:hypothetical protein
LLAVGAVALGPLQALTLVVEAVGAVAIAHLFLVNLLAVARRQKKCFLKLV